MSFSVPRSYMYVCFRLPHIVNIGNVTEVWEIYKGVIIQEGGSVTGMNGSAFLCQSVVRSFISKFVSAPSITRQ